MSMVLAKAAADEADRTHALVRALNSAVARMGRAVGLISSIAGQTAKATAEISKPGLAGPGLHRPRRVGDPPRSRRVRGVLQVQPYGAASFASPATLMNCLSWP
jgi:hypothetical protein